MNIGTDLAIHNTQLRVIYNTDTGEMQRNAFQGRGFGKTTSMQISKSPLSDIQSD